MWVWIVLASVAGVLVALFVVREIVLYRRARGVRRGGLLVLDTPAARAALAPDPDDWFDDAAETDQFRRFSSAMPKRDGAT